MAEIIEKGLQKGIIIPRDFFLTDQEFIEKLKLSGDPEIISSLQLFTGENILESTSDDYTFFTKSKARYINPKVLQNGSLVTVADLVPAFAEKIDWFMQKYKKGYYIKIVR